MKKHAIFLLACCGYFIPDLYPQNIGIGVSNPSRAKLELQGAVGATTAIFGGEGAGISLQRNGPGIGFNQYYSGGSKYIGNGFAAVQWLHSGTGWMAFDFFPSGLANATPVSVTRGMTLTPQGHLGLAGASPNGDLQFVNNLANRKIVLWETGNNDHQYYGFGIESATLRYAVDGPGATHKFYAGNNSSSSSFLMSIGGNKKVVIGTQNGTAKLGINSGDPQYTLEVMQTGSTGIILIDPNNFNNWEFRTGYNVASGGNNLWFIYNNLTTVTFKPDGGIVTISDSRLKNNIRPLGSVLPGIMELQPKRYTMKFANPTETERVGIMAQDLKKYFPQLVSIMDGKETGNKEIPDLHMVDYNGLSVLAVKAIQEQQEQIESLKLANDEQRKLIMELVYRLDMIQSRGTGKATRLSNR